MPPRSSVVWTRAASSKRRVLPSASIVSSTAISVSMSDPGAASPRAALPETNQLQPGFTPSVTSLAAVMTLLRNASDHAAARVASGARARACNVIAIRVALTPAWNAASSAAASICAMARAIPFSAGTSADMAMIVTYVDATAWDMKLRTGRDSGCPELQTIPTSRCASASMRRNIRRSGG
ncbi:Uncharacterised protein [Mycobacteroides abscessus subsp. abscessus]|nr:Uncharacterised protein [Mycobacteroides abscessus subsp. abscessus]